MSVERIKILASLLALTSDMSMICQCLTGFSSSFDMSMLIQLKLLASPRPRLLRGVHGLFGGLAEPGLERRSRDGGTSRAG